MAPTLNAPSLDALQGVTGLQRYPGSLMRANARHDAYGQQLHDENEEAMSRGESDPFYTMKLANNDATRAVNDPWDVWSQQTMDATTGGASMPRLRFPGYDPTGDTIAQMRREDQFAGGGPVNYSPSVQALLNAVRAARRVGG